MRKTIIKWKVVNTRKKDKNLPKVNSVIVFKLKLSAEYKAAFPNTKESITTSSVCVENGNMYVLYGLIKISISNGFMWSYLDDIEDSEE